MKVFKNKSIVSANMLAEIKAHYTTKVKISEQPILTNSKETEEYLRSVWSDNIEFIEEFVIVCLNRAGHTIGWVKISSGGIAGTVCDPKVIFSIALSAGASSIILSHNHPSGNLKPSQADMSLTSKISQAGKLLDIAVLDHIILTADSHYSFADERQL